MLADCIQLRNFFQEEIAATNWVDAWHLLPAPILENILAFNFLTLPAPLRDLTRESRSLNANTWIQTLGSFANEL